VSHPEGASRFRSSGDGMHDVEMAVPQRMTVVTLGAYSVASLRAFYRAIGWRENEGSDDGYTSFTLGTVRLALYPIDQLRNEASPGENVAAREAWNRVTLAVNVATRDEVDEGFAAAVEAGARPDPVTRRT